MQDTNPIRILIVDDNEAIHKDYYKVLNLDQNILDDDEAALFGNSADTDENDMSYTIDSAFQGQEALTLVQNSIAARRPYALAFVDIKMPPGWDGVETITKLWEVDPDIQIVIVSAYSEYSWEEIIKVLGKTDKFLILKKPFEVIEIRQLTQALTKKWILKRQVDFQIENLETLVEERTIDLRSALSLTNATLDATAEGIIVINKENKIVKYNKQFLNLWNITDEQMHAESSAELFRQLDDKVEKSNNFICMINNLSTSAGSNELEEWKLKTHKVLDVTRHPQILHDEVIGTVCSFRDITERKKYEEKLHFQAMHDDLTGLPNRSLLVERLQNAISDANLEDFHVNILIVDLDNFKQVNKSLGHDMGDTLLKLAGQRLVSATNKDDTVARLDGDRFVVISSQNKNEDFHPLVNKSLQTFLQPFDIGNIEINETESVFKNYEFIFTVSIGVSIYPNNGTDCDTLLKNAEAALYRAKELGGNTFQLYQPEFNKNALKHAELVSAIHTALEKEQFIIYYQPVIDLKTNSIVAVEALLRWQHPTLGIIYPKEFIPMTEILGLIVPLGEWVLRNACLQARIWQKAGFPDLHLCVNISGVQLLHNDFIALVRETLSQCEFAANNLEFDLNENALNKDIALLNVKINEFKAMGIGINIDDFGSDPQNMHFFKEVAFNKLKIINRLINQIAAAEDKSMVSVIIQMAKRMNMKVVAEGVETLAQANYLSTHECDEALGYYYSPPLDHAMFTQLLQKSNGIFKQVINKQ